MNDPKQKTQYTSQLEDPASDFGISYTYADYLKFDFENRVELIRGKIFRMSPAPRVTHQRIAGNLFIELARFFKHNKCQIFIAPLDVILPIENKHREKSNTVVQPDLCVICDPSIIEEQGCFGTPDWIIEILSPHTTKKDLMDKYSVYEESGVKEYWIVMPEEKLIEAFLLVQGKYQRAGVFLENETISPFLFPEVKLDLKEIFRIPSP